MKTRTSPSQKKRQQGGILVICMVLAGLGTIGAAAFFSLIHAKSQESLERETAMTRRNRIANSQALAKEELLQRSAATDGDANKESVLTLSNDWGAFGLALNAPLESPLSYSGALRFHKTGAVPFSAFCRDLGGTLRVNEMKYPRVFQAKSVHPALGGDLLLVEPQTVSGSPTIQFTGNLDIKGRAVFWNSNYAGATASLRADRVALANPALPKLSLLNTAGEVVLPDNAILPPTTSGFVNGVARFDGASQLIANPSSTENDYSDFVRNHAGYSVPGATPLVKTSAPATTPPGADDLTLAATIAALPPGLPNTLPETLYAYVPLSSNILSTLIGRSSTTGDALILQTLLAMNNPLPEDVMMKVLNGTTNLSADQIWPIVRSNPVFLALDGKGTAYIDLDSPSATHVEIINNIDNLILRGQADSTSQTNASTLSPLVIVYQEDGTGSPSFIKALQFEEQNFRPLVLGIKKRGDTSAVSFTFTGATAFPQWHTLLELDNVELNVNTSAVSSATLVGGIRTTRSINVTTGTLTLDREADAATVTALQPVAARNAWVENFPLTP